MTTLRILRRELSAYFASPALYIFLIVFTAATGGLLFYMLRPLEAGVASLASLFGLLPYLMLIYVPAVAMRLFAEENKTGTIELLMTLPVRDGEAVAAKFLAAYVVVLLGLGLTFPIPMIMAQNAKEALDWGPVAGGYIGMAMIAATYLSLCTLLSALTKNQIIAFILGITFCFVLFMIGSPIVTDKVGVGLGRVLAAVGVGGYLDSIKSGIFDLRSALYFASVVAALLFATVRVLDSRRWR